MSVASFSKRLVLNFGNAMSHDSTFMTTLLHETKLYVLHQI